MPTPEVQRAAAALREFVHRSGALRAQALLDSQPPALVACTLLGPIEIVVGEAVQELSHGAELGDAPDLGDVRRLPPFAVDADGGEVIGTIGGLEHLADAVARLAELLGGRSVAVAEFETTTPGMPLALSARTGEPVVVAIGEETFDLGG
jgi:hypothetical protein